MLRKFETLVFSCMLALLPFFALKVVNVTATSLAVKNSAVDLVHDLSRAKQMAKDHGVNISVASRQASDMSSPAYLIQDDTRTVEEVQLPRGVTIEGVVKFDSRGIPAKPATFTITKGPKKTTVMVDVGGVISAP